MEFEWNEDKNKANFEKHGIDFETACRIFEGPVFTFEDDRFDYGEVRENSIGLVDGALFLVVTHTDRAGKIRIISARPAKNTEGGRYDEAIRQTAER